MGLLRLMCLPALLLGVVALNALAQTKQLDASKIEKLTGLKPMVVEDENVVRVAWPRTDIQVSVDGTPLPPFAGLTSWAAFRSGEKAEAMVMGDLVLMQDEVNPVMDACFAAGLAVTALHNHFFYDEPKIYFMHIVGEGTTEQLAIGVRKALHKVQEIRKATPQPATGFGGKPIAQPSNLTAKPIEAILGKKADAKDGMLKFSFGRTVKMSCGCEVGNAMGVNTWAAFVGRDDHALVDGDFAVLEDELQTVLRALRKADIKIVAIHHHMVGESPRMLFLHYWGVGEAAQLAHTVKSALEAQIVGQARHVHDPPTDHWLSDVSGEQRGQIERHLRGLDMAMVEVGYRFSELYLAGLDRNWAYAKYQLEKLELAIRLAQERRPKRAASAKTFLEDTLPEVSRALARATTQNDQPIFQQAMERLRMDCMKCHVAENVPYFTVQLPKERTSCIRPEP